MDHQHGRLTSEKRKRSDELRVAVLKLTGCN
jgi:hypothetical protein